MTKTTANPGNATGPAEQTSLVNPGGQSSPADLVRQPSPADCAGEASPADHSGKPSSADPAGQSLPKDPAGQPSSADRAGKASPPDQHRQPSPTTAENHLNKATVKALFEQHYTALVHFLMKKLGSEQEAQDVAQEAFARLLGMGDGKVVSHLQAYLFRTANNLAIDRLRQKKQREQWHQAAAREQEEEELTPKASMENAADARQRLLRVQQVLEQLPPKCRMAFLLYNLENMSYRDISERMNLTESMVRKYVLRALRYCAEKLDAES